MSAELVVRHCSPTLAGLKTGNLFSCPCKSREEIQTDVRRLNRLLSPKGIRIVPLRYAKGKALIYIYRPSKLKKDLANDYACSLLADLGYRQETTELCVNHLISRLQNSEEFPHEIGLFLGYPPEDVRGFIENKAENCKCVGCWKVYGDEQKAHKLFNQYKKCTTVYSRQLSQGRPIERLTVTV